MNSYLGLSVRYLLQNKRRTLITIAGSSLLVVFLYAFLNIMYGDILMQRQNLREEQDYEIVMFTENEEQISTIVNSSLVKDASIGQYCRYEQGEMVIYQNAVYLNTTNPYRMQSIYYRLCAESGVEGKLRTDLASTYMQGPSSSDIAVEVYFSLLVAFVFAIIGVGLIRNSIQLCMYENIRDYGNLRCIGASKKQLKRIIFLQGFLMEIAGIIIGTILGTIVTSIAAAICNSGRIFEFKGGFHFLPLLFVLITFLGDLYFVMNENAKLVTNMSPVSAIRGEYRIRKSKIRLHDKNPIRFLIAKIFGVDGDYAFKNLMRNPGRFFKMVGALVFGIVAFVVVGTISLSVTNGYKKNVIGSCYYQFYISNIQNIEESYDMIQATFPSEEALLSVGNSRYVNDAKMLYSQAAYVAKDEQSVANHYTEEYRACDYASGMINVYRSTDPYVKLNANKTLIKGYDEDELKLCKEKLTAGTVDLDENGILLVNQEEVYLENDGFVDGLDDEKLVDLVYCDYQVGDTIDLVDMAAFHDLVDDELDSLNEEYMEKWDDYCDKNDLDIDISDSMGLEDGLSAIEDEFVAKKQALVSDAYDKLVREGKYNTYVIEGLLADDPVCSDYLYGAPTIIMKQDAFFEESGLNESQPTGYACHFNKLPNNANFAYDYTSYGAADNQTMTDSLDGEDVDVMSWMDYEKGFLSSTMFDPGFLDAISALGTAKLVALFILSIVLLVVLISILNSMNAISSEISLRKREFAQLRVIGVSKKHLIRMVCLEGVIVAITASVLGIAIGAGLSYFIFYFVATLIGWQFIFPVWLALFLILLTVFVSIAAYYFPIQHMGNDMATDLKAGSD